MYLLTILEYIYIIIQENFIYRENRYKLADLLDWCFKITNHDYHDLMYRILDLDRWPLFKLKVTLCELCTLAYPLGYLHWEGLEMVRIRFSSLIIFLYSI
jgi:hypothetical protein